MLLSELVLVKNFQGQKKRSEFSLKQAVRCLSQLRVKDSILPPAGAPAVKVIFVCKLTADYAMTKVSHLPLSVHLWTRTQLIAHTCCET